MEKSANTIARHKFLRLSARQRHKVLAALAAEALAKDEFGAFPARYAEMHAWCELDRYRPPSWLTPREAAVCCRDFHRRMAGLGAEPDSAAAAPVWRPTHDVTVVLDQVRTPYNAGSILRLIDNFGLANLIHATEWLRLDHPRLRKAARGCEAWIPVRYVADLPAFLAEDGRPVIGLENADGATPLPLWDPPPACLLVVGNESSGISPLIRKRCDALVRVPLAGFKRSMNVSHALAVAAAKIAASDTSAP